MADAGCTQEGCAVSSTGNCIEGFTPLSRCPYRIQEGEVAGDPEARPQFVRLASGEALSPEHANFITRRSPSRVVVIAGPLRSGKTTLLTSIYESFQQGPFASHLFAGSETLVGFERRCHYQRVASGRETTSTTRTSGQEGPVFLHLRVAPAEPNPKTATELLLSDISGEHFKRLRDSAKAFAAMPFLSRADHLCIVLDGDHLSTAAQRQLPRNDSRALLRSLFEANVLSATCFIDVVIAKWDLVLARSRDATTPSFIQGTKEVLEQTVGTKHPLRFFEVAARPTEPSLPFAYGLPTLFRHWAAPPRRTATPELFLPAKGHEARELDRIASTGTTQRELGAVYDLKWI